MPINQPLSALTDQRTGQLINSAGLQIRKRKGHILKVEYPAHALIVNMDGYGRVVAPVDPNIDIGTPTRQKIWAGNDCWVQQDPATGQWHVTELLWTGKCMPTTTINPPFTPPTMSSLPMDSITLQPISIPDLTFPPTVISAGMVMPSVNMPTAGSNSYDFGDWLATVDASTTVSSVGFESNRAFTITQVAARTVTTGCTLNVYVGTANAAIVVTHNSDNTWTVARKNPSDGSAISSWTSAAGNSFGVRQFVGTDLLSVTTDTYVQSEVTAGSYGVVDLFWSCGGVA